MRTYLKVLLIVISVFTAQSVYALQNDSPLVSYDGGRLTLRFVNTPLGEVFERIRAAMDMELFLEESAKDVRLSADIEAQPVGSAIESLLDGSGLNYTWLLDLSDGKRVIRLYIGDGDSGLGTSSSTRSVALENESNRITTNDDIALVDQSADLAMESGRGDDPEGETDSDAPPLDDPDDKPPLDEDPFDSPEADDWSGEMPPVDQAFGQSPAMEPAGKAQGESMDPNSPAASLPPETGNLSGFGGEQASPGSGQVSPFPTLDAFGRQIPNPAQQSPGQLPKKKKQKNQP